VPLGQEPPSPHEIHPGAGAPDGATGPSTGLPGPPQARHHPVPDQRTPTGVIEQRPLNSLVLFGQDGKVVWKAP
jgi:hypothetical protein